MIDTRAHWNSAYTTKADTAVSWYQACPERSLEFITEAASGPSTSVIDIGGGASRLVDYLLAKKYSDLTILDISRVAVAVSKGRLGASAAKVTWIEADMTIWRPNRSWDIWHDRAVFHFLTEPDAQDAYIAALKSGTKAGSRVIMATFALDGPERCSGLPVQRYSAQSLAARFGAAFELYGEGVESHATPFGTTQQFTYAAFKRRS